MIIDQIILAEREIFKQFQNFLPIFEFLEKGTIISQSDCIHRDNIHHSYTKI